MTKTTTNVPQTMKLTKLVLVKKAAGCEVGTHRPMTTGGRAERTEVFHDCNTAGRVAMSSPNWRKIYSRIWEVGAFPQMKPELRDVAMYLLTSPQTWPIGCFPFSERLAATQLGLTVAEWIAGQVRTSAFAFKPSTGGGSTGSSGGRPASKPVIDGSDPAAFGRHLADIASGRVTVR